MWCVWVRLHWFMRVRARVCVCKLELESSLHCIQRLESMLWCVCNVKLIAGSSEQLLGGKSMRDCKSYSCRWWGRIVMMSLHSCSKKKCGGGADCLALVDLSVFLKLPSLLFVCARLFLCLFAWSLGFSASWRVSEDSSDSRYTNVVCFNFLSYCRKWLNCVPDMLLCCGVFNL